MSLWRWFCGADVAIDRATDRCHATTPAVRRGSLALVLFAVGAGCTGPSGSDAGIDGTDIASTSDARDAFDASEPVDSVSAIEASTDIATDDATDAPADTAPPCPAPAAGSIEATLAWGEVLQHRMGPGVIASFPIVAAPDGRSSVVFTQGQQPSTPAGVTTEFTISRCRGVIDSSVPECYVRSVFVNNNQITSYARAANGWVDQATLGANGCWAPETAGPWYVNVRWTYETCPFASCGFSLQWTLGPY